MLKLLAWLVVVTGLCWLVQGIIWLFGSDYSVFSQQGNWIVYVFALGGVATMMAWDQHPLSHYGVVFDDKWKGTLLTGFILGFGALAIYHLTGLACGAITIGPGAPLGRIPDVLVTALGGFIASLATHIVFCGYLLGVLRQRHSRTMSVVVIASLFACANRPGHALSIPNRQWGPLCVGLFLVMILLCLIRLRSGSIVLGSGLLAGWLFVQHMIFMGRLIGGSVPGREYLAHLMFRPAWSYDVKQAPLMWALLGIAIALYTIVLSLKGEAPPVQQKSGLISVHLLRLYPLAQMNMFAPLDLWLGQLWRVRFRIGLPYAVRLVCVLAFSAVTTVLALPERLVMPVFLRRRKVKDPVFILGVHRSGTSHLQNLLALDDSFVTPRMYQVLNPTGFSFLGWPLVALMACMPPRRPMDNMSVHAFAPAEDEFAVANLTNLSPYWSMVFPQQYEQCDRLIFPDRMTSSERLRWQRYFLRFLQKLTFFSNKRPLLKSPYNTARVALLRRMFPKARFIHIHRHPHDVYRSSLHMVRHGFVLTNLQDPPPEDNFALRLLTNYRKVEEAYYRDSADLPPEQAIEVPFADLERDPKGQIERIYRQLNLRLSARFERRLDRYLQSISGYRRNKYKPLAAAEAATVNTELAPLFARGGYDPRRPQ